jgi:lipid-A-disaccharide synthase
MSAIRWPSGSAIAAQRRRGARGARPAGRAGAAGSRASEIRRLAGIFGAAIAKSCARAAARSRAADAAAHRRAGRRRDGDWPVRPRIVTGAEEKHAAFRVARAALAASGR